ncbi:MAG: AbrB family transcriptional regulator, partial [Alphaproteobacteria bacterium]|nr:AbrB family transcriptional regulator [Alphaproteobacteria bacterium]
TPGGFAEMNLIALSLNIDVAFVATHHTGRLFVVVIGAALLARMLWPTARREE